MSRFWATCFHNRLKVLKRFPKQKSIKTLIIIHVCWSNQHIRMISEGSCDTEDWNNDVENSAAHHRNYWHFKIYSNRKRFTILLSLLYFYQINTALVSRQKHTDSKHFICKPSKRLKCSLCTERPQVWQTLTLTEGDTKDKKVTLYFKVQLSLFTNQ